MPGNNLHIVLYEPEIPPNTGNVIRLVANIGAQLHLIHPLGFELSDKALRRAGLDYHRLARVREHLDFSSFQEAATPGRLFAFSTKGAVRYTDVEYAPGDYLLFGPETRGLPTTIRSSLPQEHLLRIPMRFGSRSINLSNAVAIVAYEAWRQMGFPGGS